MWKNFFLSIGYAWGRKDLLNLPGDISFTRKSLFSSSTHFDLFPVSLEVIIAIRGKMSLEY